MEILSADHRLLPKFGQLQYVLVSTRGSGRGQGQLGRRDGGDCQRGCCGVRGAVTQQRMLIGGDPRVLDFEEAAQAAALNLLSNVAGWRVENPDLLVRDTRCYRILPIADQHQRRRAEEERVGIVLGFEGGEVRVLGPVFERGVNHGLEVPAPPSLACFMPPAETPP